MVISISFDKVLLKNEADHFLKFYNLQIQDHCDILISQLQRKANKVDEYLTQTKMKQIDTHAKCLDGQSNSPYL